MNNVIKKIKSGASTHIKLIIESIIGVLLAVIFGYLLDALFPEPTQDESFERTILLVSGQLLIDSFIVWGVIYFVSEYLNRFDQETYEGMTGYLLFTVVFFLVQTQLLARFERIYKDIFNRSIDI